MTMYLSSLLIDLGNNPDRPHPGKSWLRNLYHVHQRLCMAFPSVFRKADDVDFLKPFSADDFGNSHVHVERTLDSGFLYRIDPLHNGRAMIVVQSATKPDWGYAFHNAGFLLASSPEVKSFEPRILKGQLLQFRLAANPTRRLSRNSPDVKEKSIGKRVPVPTDKLINWLARQAESAGFSIDKDSTISQPSYVYVNKKQNGEGQRLRYVLFEGLLRVADPDALQRTLIRGIGSCKAFGFGLLSLAPFSARESEDGI
jgi:CRISPR system Cascade subunit CasE